MGASLSRRFVAFFREISRLKQRGGTQPLWKNNSATLDAQGTAKELNWNRDVRRNVPMGALLAPQPKAREKTLSRRRTASPKQNVRVLRRPIYIKTPFSPPVWPASFVMNEVLPVTSRAACLCIKRAPAVAKFNVWNYRPASERTRTLARG